MKATEIQILRFVKESNKIEGIYPRAPDEDIDATTEFLTLKRVRMDDLIKFVKTVADAELRVVPGMDVYVGGHKPPAGGPSIGYSFDNLVRRANDDYSPYLLHCEYQTLHPFMDGNGRSGRVLWAWMMLNQEIPPGIGRGFLHQFYYQALDHSDIRRKTG